MVEFDLIHTPLTGNRLIEAGAGTGKTYTIVGLYLRLIVETGLTVDQILVVTYTNAATEELKTRIRSKLQAARQGFRQGGCADPLVDALAKYFADQHAAVERIEDALTDLDRAAVFTIHGFCRRILQEHAFETGNLFDTELIPDSAALIQELSEDFWRTRISNAAPELVGFLMAHKRLKHPADFQALLRGVGAIEYDIIPDVAPPDLSELAEYRAHFQNLVDQWPSANTAVAALLADPALDARRYGRLPDGREARVAALVAAMDRFADPRGTGFPLFTGFEKFTASAIRGATRKNHRAPQHPFFETAETLARQAAALTRKMEQYTLYLKRSFFDYVRTEMPRRKHEANIQFYDDLLVRVKDAMARGGGTGEALIGAVRRRFKAALVDEFQDTDPVQYTILARFFSGPRMPFFTIGDPKQSIYSFRGADIFAYLAAAERAASKYTLLKNWRSHPDMIAAVNRIFGRARRPFLFEEIAFQPGKAGFPAEQRTPASSPAMSLWYLPGRDGKPISKADAVAVISDAVADEIARMVTAAHRRAAPGDIAVLVRTHRQAQQIKQRLVQRKIPAVLHGAGNVFDSHEALEIERVLDGIAENTREEKFRTALATDMLGVGGSVLGDADGSAQILEALRHRFRQYYQEWMSAGFIRMFRRLMAREGVRARLLAFPDGDRRLTNVTHLVEILHRVSTERHLGLSGLLKWLGDQRRPDAQRLEEHQLRLESDALAVRIVTIHKSKGLEYPVVFCPFAWESSALRSDRKILFHAAGVDRRLTLDLGSEHRSDHTCLAQAELLAENLRLLYVALTRAKRRCYLAWGRINTAETSALAYLLHGAETAGAADVVQALKQQMASKSDGDLLADLQQLAAGSQGTIALDELPIRSYCESGPPPATADRLTCREFNGAIDRAWRVSSYSFLISRSLTEPEPPVIDEAASEPAGPATFAAGLQAQKPAGEEFRDIRHFPKGTRAGIFFHDLLEQVDFTAPGDSGLIERKLREYGFDAGWRDTVARTVTEIVGLVLPGDDPRLRLAGVTPNRRVNEMEFYLPLKTIDPTRLRDMFGACLQNVAAPDGVPALERLSFSTHRGFFKGYIDLLFEHGGRFYLVDWKSNYLGDRLGDYEREKLPPAMVSHFYHLQYPLYTLAADRFLRRRVPGYRYADHFGGVFYIFIRGVRAASGNRYGVYYDLPDPACIAALERGLITGPD
jgi:exodeoxyribonuclease V beta subunit